MLELRTILLQEVDEPLLPFLAGRVLWGAEMRVRHEQTVAVQHDRIGISGRFFHGGKDTILMVIG